MDVNCLVMVKLSRSLILVDGCKLSRLLNIILLGLVLLVLSNRHRYTKLTLTASGYEQKALVAQPAGTSPGTLARKLSRRASHHGAIFASPGER
jgi:hypothetical protein